MNKDPRIGDLDWWACKYCRHYRPSKGGCLPLDKDEVTLTFGPNNADSVECSKYDPKEDAE